jgi:lysophospholipase L1-like esterase
MRAPRPRTLILFAALPLLILALVTTDRPVPPQAGPPPEAPRAIVALGDSTMSGEGAGNYEQGTRGENGDWCHRSPVAEIHETGLPGVTQSINLACSGATAEDVALGDSLHDTEPSQARQLAAVAKRYHVTAVVVAVGANDDPRFADTVNLCLQASLHSNAPDCSAQLADWPQRIGRMIPKVVHALRDVRATMDKAGYPANSYSLVLQGYAAPVGPDVYPGLQSLAGCPFRTTDLTWMRNTAVVQLNAGLRRAAEQAGARFLDLSRAGIGHEACSGGNNFAVEWFTRLTIDWVLFQDNQNYGHSTQESFHPNDRGHAQIGHCLGEFLAARDTTGACLPGGDGKLHLVGPAS